MKTQQAFADAIELVKATRTPHDGGVTEAAVKALQDLSLDVAFQEKFAARMEEYEGKIQAVRDATKQAEEANKATADKSKGSGEAQPAHPLGQDSGGSGKASAPGVASTTGAANNSGGSAS